MECNTPRENFITIRGIREIRAVLMGENGVSEGIRTPGRWSHNPELYQLSYAHHKKKCRRNNSTIPEAMP
jgi:hypothetical protein